MRLSLLASVLLSVVAQLACAEAPASLDQPYPGQLSLAVDLSHAATKVFHVKETIPVQAGAFSLYYPKWIPGDHAATGPIADVAGLMITGNGQKIAWNRDPSDMYLLHLHVPEGVSQLNLAFQLLSPGEDDVGLDGASATPKLVALEFNQVAFYPAANYVRQIQIQPTVTLPVDWQFGSALEVQQQSANTVTFKPVSFENLVDSPLVAGAYFKRIDLDPNGQVPAHLDIVADSQDNLKLSDKQIERQRAVVVQGNKLFGAHHYQHYDFLTVLSAHVEDSGLEHSQSSDNRLPADFFTDDTVYLRDGDLMTHEYVHSWNGKFRRPADLWIPNFNVPMQDDLLWVYEGLTEYYGQVLSARAGIWSPEQFRDSLADTTADMSHRAGRQSLSLQNSATGWPLVLSAGRTWADWRRGGDFYPEGILLWLDVDTQIRTLSQGKRSLDDFARAFYGMDNGSYVTRTYTFDDVVATLNQVQANDWAQFLRSRLDYTGTELPEHGVEHSGWKLVYDDQPSPLDKAPHHPGLNLSYSLGLSLNEKGSIRDVSWGGPAFNAGLAPGMTLSAVNGKAYSADVLKDAVTQAESNHEPIELLVQNDEYFSTVKIDYHEGLKYPHLVRNETQPDLLAGIVAARK